MKRRKKVLAGYMFSESLEDLNFRNLDAWKSTPPILGLYLCLMKNKKDAGKFESKKVRITIEETK